MKIEDFKGPLPCNISEETRFILTMRILEDKQKLVDELIFRGIDEKVAKEYISGPIVELK